ncbi:MAG: ABC transporter ATP-binding protein [Chloroflexi bacterium]|nr:ABC transporter ATP-binding protein [Chloroflexota bacterium]
MLIETKDLTKTYRMGSEDVHALCNLNIQIDTGEFVAIMGPSGSGKSTLMNLLGCLDQPTTGEYMLDGVKVSSLNDNQLAAIRNKKIGFVFQSYNLLPRTTAYDNVMIPLIYSGSDNRHNRVVAALKSVNLADRIYHKPNELSGGEQQRVAIARALINNPSIIMADEPTGNLDSKTGLEIMGIFQRLNQNLGITVVFVTHSEEIAEYTRRVIRLHDGELVSDAPVTNQRIAPQPEVAKDAHEN